MQPADDREWVRITTAPLDVEGATQWVMRDTCGAVVTFCGTVRTSSSTGHEITALEYETSDDHAERRVRDVITDARRRWPEIDAVVVHHRTGRVELGDVTVVVAVSSPHRAEAFAAGQYCIDTVKATVPMWKREHWDGGSTWSQEATPIATIREE